MFSSSPKVALSAEGAIYAAINTIERQHRYGNFYMGSHKIRLEKQLFQNIWEQTAQAVQNLGISTQIIPPRPSILFTPKVEVLLCAIIRDDYHGIRTQLIFPGIIFTTELEKAMVDGQEKATISRQIQLRKLLPYKTAKIKLDNAQLEQLEILNMALQEVIEELREDQQSIFAELIGEKTTIPIKDQMLVALEAFFAPDETPE